MIHIMLSEIRQTQKDKILHGSAYRRQQRSRMAGQRLGAGAGEGGVSVGFVWSFGLGRRKSSRDG